MVLPLPDSAMELHAPLCPVLFHVCPRSVLMYSNVVVLDLGLLRDQIQHQAQLTSAAGHPQLLVQRSLLGSLLLSLQSDPRFWGVLQLSLWSLQWSAWQFLSQ